MERKTEIKDYVEVTNRNNGRTTYTLPNGLYREFGPKQSRKLELEELKELRDCQGGEYILQNFLIVKDKTALEYLDLNPEPEYFYTEKEITELVDFGSLDQLEDCLNFAPEGVIDLVKDIAIKTELPDTRKRKMIFEKTGFSIDNAIKINQMMETDDSENAEIATTGRKAAPIVSSEPVHIPVRKYNIVDKK